MRNTPGRAATAPAALTVSVPRRTEVSLGATALAHVEDLVAGICARGATAGEAAVLRLPDHTPCVLILLSPESSDLLGDCALTLIPCAGEACGRGEHPVRLMVVLSAPDETGLAVELDPEDDQSADVLRQFLFDGELRVVLVEPEACQASVAEFPLGKAQSAVISTLVGV